MCVSVIQYFYFLHIIYMDGMIFHCEVHCIGLAISVLDLT